MDLSPFTFHPSPFTLHRWLAQRGLAWPWRPPRSPCEEPCVLSLSLSESAGPRSMLLCVGLVGGWTGVVLRQPVRFGLSLRSSA